MKVFSSLLLFTLFGQLLMAQDDFTVQLPPIPTSVALEDADLPVLHKWLPEEETTIIAAENSLLPLPESDLVISIATPAMPLPETVVLPNQNLSE